MVYGALDGVTVTQLIAKKVSLGDHSIIQSSLKFLEDATILGKLN